MLLLVGSENAGVGFADGMKVLRRGGRALDAVDRTRNVEDGLDAARGGDGDLAECRRTIGVLRLGCCWRGEKQQASRGGDAKKAAASVWEDWLALTALRFLVNQCSVDAPAG